MNEKFVDFMKSFKGQRLAVAVSGGVDSMALMYWLVKIGFCPVVLTMDHGLRAQSAAEAAYVTESAAGLGLECVVAKWNGDRSFSNLEAAARDARYDAFFKYCRENKIDALLTAHQADDQIETFLMNLGRGSGIYGLAGIRPEQMRDRVRIIRPLLNVPRSELLDYCKKEKIHYFKDAMNDDENFTRVRIRKNRHVLSDKLGISDSRILTAIDSLNRVRDLLESEIGNLAASVMTANSGEGRGYMRAVFPAEFLFDLPLEIQLKLLSALVQKIGGNQYPPRLENIRNALSKLMCDNKFTLAACTLRRLHDKILIVPEGQSTSFKTKRIKRKNNDE